MYLVFSGNTEIGVPANLMYQDCQTSKLALGQNMEVVILESVNPHTIFVIARVSRPMELLCVV